MAFRSRTSRQAERDTYVSQTSKFFHQPMDIRTDGIRLHAIQRPKMQNSECHPFSDSCLLFGRGNPSDSYADLGPGRRLKASCFVKDSQGSGCQPSLPVSIESRPTSRPTSRHNPALLNRITFYHFRVLSLPAVACYLDMVSFQCTRHSRISTKNTTSRGSCARVSVWHSDRQGY